MLADGSFHAAGLRDLSSGAEFSCLPSLRTERGRAASRARLHGPPRGIISPLVGEVDELLFSSVPNLAEG